MGFNHYNFRDHTEADYFKLKSEIEKSLKKYLKVPTTLKEPHKWVLEGRRDFDRSDKTPPYWSKFLHNFADLSVAVSKEQSYRALCFLDTLFKAVEARGHKLKLIKPKKICFLIDQEEFEYLIVEKLKRKIVPGKYGMNESVDTPCGILKFQLLDPRTEWREQVVYVESLYK